MPNDASPSVVSSPLAKVSVAMITYNQENFIGQAIESVLMQETSFPVELIIGEDCSTDGTRAIVRRYAQTHPGIVRPLLQDRNLGAAANFEAVLAACKGDYIALLEGDDYWTDPSKLQRQVEFLDKHPDYAISFHLVTAFDNSTGDSHHEYPPSEYRKPVLELRDLLERNFIQTCSAVFPRRFLPALSADYWRLKIGDWPLFIRLAQNGPVAFLNCCMANYRLHAGGVYSSRASGDWRAACIPIYAYLGNYLSGSHADRIADKLFNDWSSLCLDHLSAKEFEKAKALFQKYFGVNWKRGGLRGKARVIRLGAMLSMPRLFSAYRWGKRTASRLTA
jgi:glycosyltransferase involved in cell wall biosynthesis